jgi:hypothetical protein
LRDVSVLHLEPTDVCQLACPLCSRETDASFNKNLHHHLTVQQLVALFDTEFIANLDKMFMCGNYGDPAAGKHTLDLYQYCRSINPTITLGMNTNGALQNVSWWKQLAGIFSQSRDYVVFSIDGLEDTNHLYRRNCNWSKLIENAQAFISAGGSAHWDMLVYQHNQHQVDLAQALARDMGFTWFRAKLSKRPLVNGLAQPDQWQPVELSHGKIRCHALAERSIYVDARGVVNPCCWLGNTKLHTELNFTEIQQSWESTPHPVCRSTCSSKNNSTNFASQWQREVALC